MDAEIDLIGIVAITLASICGLIITRIQSSGSPKALNLSTIRSIRRMKKAVKEGNIQEYEYLAENRRCPPDLLHQICHKAASHYTSHGSLAFSVIMKVVNNPNVEQRTLLSVINIDEEKIRRKLINNHNTREALYGWLAEYSGQRSEDKLPYEWALAVFLNSETANSYRFTPDKETTP